MVGEAVKVGQEVRLPERHQSGKVVEVDNSLLVARVGLSAGKEMWARLDELEEMDKYRTEYQSIGGVV